MHSLVTTTTSDDKTTFKLFEDERQLFLYLESIGVTYYPERGESATVNDNGLTVYEYGKVGH